MGTFWFVEAGFPGIMSMSSWTSRVNSIFSYFGVVMAVLIAANVATTYFSNPNIDVKLHFDGLKKLEQATKFDGDYAWFSFSLDVDLTPAWHWGTKQIFVYLTAHYRSSQYAENEVVVWDYIVVSPEQAHIQLKNKKIKYPLRDISHGLTKNEVKLVLSYQMHPIAGVIVDRHFDDPQHTVVFQTNEYTN